MFGLLRAFKSRLLDSAGPDMGQDLPALPYEIWLLIFEMTIYPEAIIRMEFVPHQIAAGFTILTNPWTGSQGTTQLEARLARKHLKLVCKTWKQAIDAMKLNEKWVVDHSWGSLPGPTPIDTYQCSRLNVDYRIPRDASQISICWTHPVSAVSINITQVADSSPVFVKSVNDLLSFPEHIRALRLDLGRLRVSKKVVTDLQTKVFQLTTLHIALSNNSLFQTSVTIPTLITLSLSIPPHIQLANTQSLRWFFPALRNLSLYDNLFGDTRVVSMPIHPFFVTLLKTHRTQIRSLLVFPMTREIFHQGFSLCWIYMPKLQALAANFGRTDLLYTEEVAEDIGSPILKSRSIRQLIHYPLHGNDMHEKSIAKGLRNSILSCDQLEGITLIGLRDELRKSVIKGTGSKAIKRLLTLCDERRIQIWEQPEGFRERKLLRDFRRENMQYNFYL